MLSKKYYVEIATILREATYLPTVDRDFLISDFSRYFKRDNPRFDARRFRDYIEKNNP